MSESHDSRDVRPKVSQAEQDILDELSRNRHQPAREWLSQLYEIDPTTGDISLRDPYRSIVETIKDCSKGTSPPEVDIITDFSRDVLADSDDPAAILMGLSLHNLGALRLRSLITTGPCADRNVDTCEGLVDLYDKSNIPVIPGLPEFNSENADEPHRKRFNSIKAALESGDTKGWRNFYDLPELKSNRQNYSRPSSLAEFFSPRIAEATATGTGMTFQNLTGPQTLNHILTLLPSDKSCVSKVVMQGGVDCKDNKVTAREDARNNRYDMDQARQLVGNLQDEGIKTDVFTKKVAFATKISPGFFAALASTGDRGMDYVHQTEREVNNKQTFDISTNDKFFPNLTNDILIGNKYNFRKDQRDAVLSYTNTHGTDNPADVTDESHKEHSETFNKCGTPYANFMTYDLTTTAGVISEKLQNELGLFKEYNYDQNSEAEKTIRTFGKDGGDTGLHNDRLRDFMVATLAHLTMTKLDETQRDTLRSKLTRYQTTGMDHGNSYDESTQSGV